MCVYVFVYMYVVYTNIDMSNRKCVPLFSPDWSENCYVNKTGLQPKKIHFPLLLKNKN